MSSGRPPVSDLFGFWWLQLGRIEPPTSGSIISFPPLAECRAAFEKLVAQKIEWDGPDEWQDVQAPEYPPM